jgi:DNA polymerase III epsilon subunit family exonuclease
LTIIKDSGIYLQRKLLETTFVAFDVETTGLNSQLDEIVEIGMARFHVGGLLRTSDYLIHPKFPIPPQITTVHGITNAMVAQSPPLEAALPDILSFFDDSILIAHNAKFDVSFLGKALAEAGFIGPPNPVLCTRRLSRSLILGMRTYGLSTIARKFNITTGVRHRALPDALLSAKVFARLVSRINPLWDMTLEELLEYHGSPYFFSAVAPPPSETELERLAALRAIQSALKMRHPLVIEYRADSGTCTRRSITPLKIHGSGPETRVLAYCHLRRENRTFRLSCIMRVL